MQQENVSMELFRSDDPMLSENYIQLHNHWTASFHTTVNILLDFNLL